MRFVFIFFIVLVSVCYGQTDRKHVSDYPIPKDLESCFDILDKTLPKDEYDIIKNFPEDSILYHDKFSNGTEFLYSWKLLDSSKLTKYFNDMGLVGSEEIFETILVSYHRHLNTEPIDLTGQIAIHQVKQKAEYEKHLKLIQQDTINGVYIPKDLRDCFLTLDSLLSNSDIDEIKSLPDRSETIIYHFGFGRSLRNNWGLWGGSRLQKYFIDRNITHPDDMSGIILEFYYDWLHNKHEEWKEFDKTKGAVMRYVLLILFGSIFFYSCNDREKYDAHKYNTSNIKSFFKIENESLEEEIMEFVKECRKDTFSLQEDLYDQFVVMVDCYQYGDSVEYVFNFATYIFTVFFHPPDMISFIGDDIMVLIYTPIHDFITFSDDYVLEVAKLAFPKQYKQLENNNDSIIVPMSNTPYWRTGFIEGERVGRQRSEFEKYYRKNRELPEKFRHFWPEDEDYQ